MVLGGVSCVLSMRTQESYSDEPGTLRQGIFIRYGENVWPSRPLRSYMPLQRNSYLYYIAQHPFAPRLDPTSHIYNGPYPSFTILISLRSHHRDAMQTISCTPRALHSRSHLHGTV